jgi:hypothetical protein
MLDTYHDRRVVGGGGDSEGLAAVVTFVLSIGRNQYVGAKCG